MFKSLYSNYEAVCKGYITAFKREYEFNLQSTEFEFELLLADLGEIQNSNEVRHVLSIGLSIVGKLSSLGLREVVMEAA